MNLPKEKLNPLQPGQVLAITVAIIFVAEAVIMATFAIFATDFSPVVEMIVDATALCLLVLPVLILLVYRPMIRQIRQLKIMEEELTYHSTYDPLTQLYNRRVFDKRLAEELNRATRYQHSISVFLIDLDHFKEVNDTYGHQTGDLVLEKFARRLENAVRKTDYAARYGGEEFVIILPETDLTTARELADRLCETLAAEPFEIEGVSKLDLTASIGIATFPNSGGSCGDLLDAADHAMYQAKRNGRNQAVYLEPDTKAGLIPNISGL